MNRFAFFDTGLGRCAIAWGEDGILGLELPARDDGATRRRVLRVQPGAVESSPPPEVSATIAAVAALLAGEPRDLGGARLDMSGVPEFHRRVYAAAREIPPGSTRSYGEVAARIGEPRASQAVGRALGANPFPVIVPCHRVVAADGGMRGFSAPGGTNTKRRMLEIEGAVPAGLF